MPTIPLALIVAAKLRDQLRWARQHVYFLLVLSPPVLFFSFIMLEKIADRIGSIDPGPAGQLLIATIAQSGLILLSLSTASAELFHLRRPESFLESMPLTVGAHFRFALFSRLFRTLGLTAALLAVRLGLSPVTRPAHLALMLAAYLAITATSEVWAALNWIHWSHTRNVLFGVAAIAVSLVGVAFGAWLLVVILRSGDDLSAAESWVGAACIAAAFPLYGLTLFAHRRWRAADVEFARRILPSSRVSFQKPVILIRRLGAAVSSLLIRDLQLTARVFSSAVYVSAAVATLSLIGLVLALTSNLLPPDQRQGLDLTWLPSVMAAKFVCIIVALSLASLVPVLVAYQVPGLWLERAVGTTGAELAEAKIWYARIISSPAPVASWIAAVVTQTVPASYALPLLAECIWLWWLIASFVGGLGYETPARPATALVMMIAAGGAAGFMAASIWPFGFVIYFLAMRGLVDRARARARYFLITGDD